MIKKALSLFLCFCTFILILSSCGGSEGYSSPQEVASEYVKAEAARDTRTLIKCINSATLRSAYGIYDASSRAELELRATDAREAEIEEDLEEVIKKQDPESEEYYRKKYINPIDREITRVTADSSPTRLNKYREKAELSNDYGFTKEELALINNYAIIYVAYIDHSDEDEEDEEKEINCRLVCIEIDHAWYILDD